MERGIITSSLALVIALLALIAGCSGQEADGISWTGDIPAALALARQAGKPVMVDFMATWCPPCHAMEDSTFSDPAVIEKAASFVPVRIDVDEQQDVAIQYDGNARKYGGVGIPNILFMTSDGTKIRHIVGYYGPEALISVMDSVLALAM